MAIGVQKAEQMQNKLRQQLFTYSDQERCFLCSSQKLRPLKSQASSRLASQICEEWLSPNSASRSIIPECPQHPFEVRSHPSPSLLLEDSCALPAAFPCLEKLPQVPSICWYYSSQTSKCPARAQVPLKWPYLAQSRDFEPGPRCRSGQNFPLTLWREEASTTEGLLPRRWHVQWGTTCPENLYQPSSSSGCSVAGFTVTLTWTLSPG